MKFMKQGVNKFSNKFSHRKSYTKVHVESKILDSKKDARGESETSCESLHATCECLKNISCKESGNMKAITLANTVEDIEILSIYTDRTEIYDFAREYLIISSEIKEIRK